MNVLEQIGFGGSLKDDGLASFLRKLCIGNLILSLTLIPGSYASFCLIDSWGRRPIQLMGFAVLTVLFFVMGMLSCIQCHSMLIYAICRYCLYPTYCKHQIDRFLCALLCGQFLLQFRTKHDDLYRSGRSISYALSFDRARYFSRQRKARSYRHSGCVFSLRERSRPASFLTQPKA